MTHRLVEILLDWTAASVGAADAGLVGPLLACPVITFSTAAGVVVGRRATESLGRREGGRLMFPAKLALVHVAPALAARGFTVRLTPEYPWPPAPDPADLAAVPGPAADLFSGYTPARLGGLIPARPVWEPARLIPDLIRLYPQSRWVVAARNRYEERWWLDRLCRARLPLPVMDFGDLQAHWVCAPRVFVTSLNKLDACQPEDFDRVVVPDLGPLLALAPAPPGLVDTRPRRDYPLLRHPGVPAFGFLPSGVILSPGEVLRLGAYFGLELPLPGIGRAGARVVRVPPPAPNGVFPDPETDPAGYRRAAVWAHAARNEYVAAVAIAVAAGDAAAFLHLGLGDAVGPGVRVAVLVENREHALALAARLPGWVVHHAGTDGPVTAPVTGNTIVTEVWAAGQTALDADVLVDARGWGPLDLGGFPPPARADGRPVVLVDVADRVPRPAAEWARRRDREYRRRGWRVERGNAGA
jgi:hypothetical protein